MDGGVCVVISSASYIANPEQQKFMWEQFKVDFNKRYDTMDTETFRFGHFLRNLKTMDERNALEMLAGGNAVHGITKYSDMSQEEFESTMLRSNPTMRDPTNDIERIVVSEVPSLNNSVGALVDWTGKYTTPVKDQGYCGSCWAFSATEQIESDAIRTLGKSWTLSPAQITQCDTTSYGCNGGWTENAYNYVKKAGGLETNSAYPYTSTLYNGSTGKCASVSTSFVVTVSAYYTISGETNMANYVTGTGPLSVCLDASSFNSYTGGIMSVCGKSVNHCVQAVGVDTTSYWKVRNSWGTSWGEAGYIRLKYGQNTCAITHDPTHVAVVAK